MAKAQADADGLRDRILVVVYGCFVSWAVTVLAAAWGASSSMMPIAAGQAHGSAIQEGIITVGLVTSAAALTAATILVLWGLRAYTTEESDKR